MDSKEFNKIAATLMKQELEPLGFKKSRSTVTIYDAPKIMTVYKHTFRGTFLGYYLAVTYDFMRNVKVDNGKVLPPPYIEDYPTSISILRLSQQYEKHDHVSEFDCGLHLHSWDQGLSTGSTLGGLMAERSVGLSVKSSAKAAEAYIRETSQVVKTNGMKFLDQITPAISLEFLSRHFEGPWSPVKPLQEALETYLSGGGGR